MLQRKAPRHGVSSNRERCHKLEPCGSNKVNVSQLPFFNRRRTVYLL